MGKKIIKILFLVIFIVFLIVPLLLTNLKPDAVSEFENRKLAKFPDILDSEGRLNKDIITGFETWLNDNIGLRNELYAFNSKIQYDVFDTSAVSTVKTGKDGWLFFAQNHNLDMASGNYPLSEEQLQKICNRQINIKNELARQGIEYVLILAPSKVSIYPEYIRGNFGITETPVDILAAYLEENSDVKVIRLKDALLEEKSRTDDLLYYKTDTHWNAYGAYIAYREIIHKLSEWNLINDTPVEVTFGNGIRLCDMMGNIVETGSKYEEQAVTSYTVVDPKSYVVQQGEMYDYIQTYVAEHGLRRSFYHENADTSKLSFLVYADSMFVDYMRPLLAENASSMACLWTYDIDQKVIDNVKPDVIFVEITERMVSQLQYTSEEFLHYSAEVTNEDILNIRYCDFGAYEKMLFPIWSEENHQDDLIWYEPVRVDENHWELQVDLNQHRSNGVYHIHFYSVSGNDGREYVTSKTFDVGTRFE